MTASNNPASAAAQPRRRPAPRLRESIGWGGLIICADYRTNLEMLSGKSHKAISPTDQIRHQYIVFTIFIVKSEQAWCGPLHTHRIARSSGAKPCRGDGAHGGNRNSGQRAGAKGKNPLLSPPL